MYISFQDVKEISYIGQIERGFQGEKKCNSLIITQNQWELKYTYNIHTQGGISQQKFLSR